ncbi:hypothetical protein HY970_01725 [Candidatus Kaiserbacteria bacterium]|nr:hypothetical protein [Candidatus Kaiserbacteria bacterium]
MTQQELRIWKDLTAADQRILNEHPGLTLPYDASPEDVQAAIQRIVDRERRHDPRDVLHFE